MVEFAAMASLREARAVPVHGGGRLSLVNRGEIQRCSARHEPVRSLVPEARPPPKETWPMSAPVGLSLR